MLELVWQRSIKNVECSEWEHTLNLMISAGVSFVAEGMSHVAKL